MMEKIMYIKLLLKFKKANTQLRKLYVRKMIQQKAFGEDNSNPGFLIKFNNSIGFKDVEFTTSRYGSISEPKVQNPKEYIAPATLLLHGMKVEFNDNEILSFTIKKHFFKHTIQKY